MVEWWTTERDMEDDDENDTEGTSIYQKSGVQLGWLGLADLIWVSVRSGLRLYPDISGMVQFAPTCYSLTSQFLMMIALNFSFPQSQLYYHLSTRSWFISLYLSIPRSWVNTEHSIHKVLHHPTIDCLACPASLPSLISLWILFYSTLDIPKIRSFQITKLSAPVMPPSRSTCSTLTTTKYSWNFTRSWPQLDIQYCWIMALECISRLGGWWPQSAFISSRDLSLHVPLQTCLIMVLKCILKLVQSWLPSASLSFLNLGLQLHLQTYLIIASHCISKLTWAQSGETVELSQHPK